MIFREVYVIICFWSFNVISRDKYNEINFNMKYIFNIYMFIFYMILILNGCMLVKEGYVIMIMKRFLKIVLCFFFFILN